MEEIILNTLYDCGYELEDIKDIGKDYYITYSPISEDKNTMSCIIFKETGNLKLFNGTISLDNKTYTTLTLTTWLRGTKVGLKYYIDKVIFDNYINRKTFIDYIEYCKNRVMSLCSPNNRFEKIRKILYKNYILDIDIIGLNVSKTNIKKEIKKPKQVKIDTEIVEPNEIEKKYLDKYILQRGLPKLSIKYKVIVYNGIYRKPSLYFKYPCGFEKYRIAFEKEKTNRFRSSGRYNSLYEVRRNNSKTVYLVEGEIEGITISQYIQDDILCLHNTNSLPNNLEQLKNYNRIIVKIDKDKFLENKKAFVKLSDICETIIDYKIDSFKDYNDLHKEKKLTKEIIETINTKED